MEATDGSPLQTDLNFEDMANKTVQAVALLESVSPPQSFDLTPFNMTQIQLSWEQFYRAGDSLQNFDLNR